MGFIKWAITDTRYRYALLHEIYEGKVPIAMLIGWWMVLIVALPIAPIVYLIIIIMNKKSKERA